MIVDAHVHVWPDAVAARALAEPAGDLVRYGDGTVAGALAAMDAARVDVAVSLGVASTAKHVASVNRFAASLDPNRFVGLGAIHPDLTVDENLASLTQHGLVGVKVHPLYQGFALDDARLWEIFDAMQGKFVAVVHVGEGDTPESNARCTPAMMREIVTTFPKLDVVACHFGGYRQLDKVEELIVGLPVYVDTSWPPGLSTVDPGRVRRIIERHGAERVIFASDWPMAEPAESIAAIEHLGLSEEDTAAILGGNACRLFGLG